MTTHDMILRLGLAAVALVLAANLAVAVLRLLSLPLAAAAIALDGLADLAARPLPLRAADGGETP